MKNRWKHWISLIFLILALGLIVSGVGLGVKMFTSLEALAVSHSSHEMLLDSLQYAAVSAMTFGGMTVLGIAILVILILHQARSAGRLEKEAEALRRKNKAAEALNRQIRDLAHHQRLQTIGTLTSSIAHEFNNLLTPIMGYSLMALEKLPPEDALYDDILEIYNSSRQAKTIISRLNDLSRKQSDTSFRLVSPDAVVKKTLDVALPAKPKRVEIKLNLNCWDQRLIANEIQLSQLLLNLILNGFHAMGEGPGTLTVDTSFDESHICIRVEDTGCGIPEELRDKIFEPFFTTKDAGKGTGLGLAIAAQVVEDHRGEITVDSRVGEGTTICVRLPREKAENQL